MPVRRLLSAWSLTVSLLVVSCTMPVRNIPPRPNLGISNDSALRVTVVVNGIELGEFPARHGEPNINVTGLPELPWSVEARSPSGRLLTSMKVEPGAVVDEVGLDGNASHQGTMGRVDLSCGTVWIWAGDRPSGGPAPPEDPGSPGDCDP